SVLIAQLKHSVGQLLPSGNQVIYTNAFSDFAADLVCTYRRCGFEDDLIIRDHPPSAETFGLASDRSQLQLLTEFFNTPEPEQTPAPTMKVSPQNPNLDSVTENISDSALKFGAMKMIHGKAFS